MTTRQYNFSVVTPVYKVEEYLEEAIESVVSQTIGFERNIQLVLVNDGSPDESESICLRYAKRYPDNVVYVKQDNAGVSAARNHGLQHARGRYVNFMDSDDRWSPDAFKIAFEFLEGHPEVDLVAARLAFFGARTGYHPLDYRFESDRVIDIDDEYDSPQLHVNSVFVRSEAIDGHVFDTRLRISEDFKFLAPVILERRRYGVLASTEYLYRRREAGDSAINLSRQSRTWYLDTPRYCYDELFELCRQKFGALHPFILYSVMYDLQWRLIPPLGSVLSQAERSSYVEQIAGLLRQIPERMIVQQRSLPAELKLGALALRRGEAPEALREQLSIARGCVYLDWHRIRVLRFERVTVDILEVDGDELVIEGHLNSLVPRHRTLLRFITATGQFEARLIDRPDRDRFSLGDCIFSGTGFVVRIPLDGVSEIAPEITLDGDSVDPQLVYGRLAPLSEAVDTSYFRIGRYAVGRRRNRIVVTADETPRQRRAREWRRIVALALDHRRPSLAAYRIAHSIARRFVGDREVWLFSDRSASAGDNGEALFRYACTRADRDVICAFVIARSSPDYRRLRATGRVLRHDSIGHRLWFLLATKIVSSHADDYVINAFGEGWKYIKDLYGFDFAFLQHGITKDDLSRWLNRYNKNVKLFVTAAVPERRSILDGAYFYDESVVKLTGFPRHDALLGREPAPTNRVAIMPTWRRGLVGAHDPKSGLRQRVPGFENSEFFTFYNRLINDERLLSALNRKGLTARFIPHPMLAQEADLFQGNDLVSVLVGDCDYNDEIRSSGLLITDYSSLAFEFALLRHSVVYAQFDREQFFEEQLYDPGYFSYEIDGFGPVCTDYDETVDAAVDAIERGMGMDAEYAGRAERFFPDLPGSACERVYEAIRDI